MKTIYEAFNTANLDDLAHLLHPNVDWVTTPPDGRTRGHEQVCAFFASQFAEWTMNFQSTSIVAGEDGRITAQVRCTIGRKDGTGQRDIELDMEHLFTMRDGLIRKVDLVQCNHVA